MLKSAPDEKGRRRVLIQLASQLFDEPLDKPTMQKFMAIDGKLVMRLFDDYRPSKYAGETILVRTTQNLISFDSEKFWGLEKVLATASLLNYKFIGHS